MILDNGIVRTLDPSLPVSRALAIAGDRIASKPIAADAETLKTLRAAHGS